MAVKKTKQLSSCYNLYVPCVAVGSSPGLPGAEANGDAVGLRVEGLVMLGGVLAL